MKALKFGIRKLKSWMIFLKSVDQVCRIVFSDLVPPVDYSNEKIEFLIKHLATYLLGEGSNYFQPGLLLNY